MTQLLTAVDLRCEYAREPINVDSESPRLSWRLGVAQGRSVAYQIQVGRAAFDESALSWDSGRVASGRTTWIAYEGSALEAMTRYHWRVRVWDEGQGAGPWSELSFFETGRRGRAWEGRWIGGRLMGSTRSPVPVPYLRRSFTLPDRPTSARLYVTALGLHACRLNGQRVGQDELRPGWTDFTRRVVYDIYDVTGLMVAGENVLGTPLGDGWYCGRIAWFGRQNYGDRPCLLAELRLEMPDGGVVVIPTDDRWRWDVGPILYSDPLDGESYDARQEQAGWDAAGFDDSHWQPVQVFEPPQVATVASPSPPVRAIVRLPGHRIATDHAAVHLFDLRQNIAGRARLRLRGKRGKTVRIRYGEMLRDDGRLYTENLRTAAATDWYTLRGGAEETYEPLFTFHGFRYVEVEAKRHPECEILGVEGVVLHNDMPMTGSFACSEPLVNQLFSNLQWGQRGNYLEVPTDCPQRDERLGWTGDAQVFAATACFNMDVSGFMAKWLVDVRDAQAPSGSYPKFVPNPEPSIDADGGPAWAEAGILCAWRVYVHYGDSRVLREHYDSMSRFARWLDETSADGIRPITRDDVWAGFGDWLALDSPDDDRFGGTPRQLVGTAYHVHAIDHMAKIADVLGEAEQAEQYRQRASTLRAAFVRRFATPDVMLAGHTQTAYLLALAFDLLPEAQRASAVAHLVQRLDHDANHLRTGFVGTPLLAPVLTRFGRADLAYRLLLNRTYPGWLYSVLQGATTMWERWNSYSKDRGFGPVGMNSFNHYAYGAIGQWMYESVLGIAPMEAHPGFARFVAAPTPDPTGQITSASGHVDTLHGRIRSGWRAKDGRFSYDLTVPPNTRAALTMPFDAAVTGTGSATPGTSPASWLLPPGDYRLSQALPETFTPCDSAYPPS